jgi:hypothetical protein
MTSTLDRFMAKVEVGASGCWVWTAGLGRGGYAKFKAEGRTVGAHRWAYEHFVGPIPEGLQLDHTCHDPASCVAPCPHRRCVNPSHLEAVTCQENLLRGGTFQAANAAKTHCVHGHEYTPENTMADGGGRSCRTCKRAQVKRWREANRETVRERDREAKRRVRAKQRA